MRDYVDLFEKLQITDPGPAAATAQHEFVSDRSVALLLRPREAELHIGSGTCVRIGDAYLVATAAHNLRNVELTEITVMPRGARLEPTIPVVAVGSDKRADIAWLELETVATRNSILESVELSQTAPLPDHSAERQVVLLQGFPAARYEASPDPSAGPLVQSDGLFTLVVPPGLQSRPSTYRDFCVEYPPWDGSLEGEPLADPPGVSGGGLWIVPVFQDGQMWSLDQTKLIALAKSWLPGSRELYCVPIESWLDLVKKDRPDLQEHMDAAVKPPRVLGGA